jgi:hypothetical protein
MASDNFDFGFKIQSICSIEQWSWVPLLGPHLGGLLGALIYTLFIEAHWPDDREVEGNYYKSLPKVYTRILFQYCPSQGNSSQKYRYV